MRITKQARRDAKSLFRSCLVDGRLDEARARAAVRRVLEAKPRGFLGTLTHFQRLARLHLESRRARIENAVESPPALRTRVQQALERRYGPGLEIRHDLNPELLGGLRIKVGSDVYDGSVRARLEQLKSRF
jgi:F-type H+-transporting ATPase subunit delta